VFCGSTGRGGFPNQHRLGGRGKKWGINEFGEETFGCPQAPPSKKLRECQWRGVCGVGKVNQGCRGKTERGAGPLTDDQQPQPAMGALPPSSTHSRKLGGVPLRHRELVATRGGACLSKFCTDGSRGGSGAKKTTPKKKNRCEGVPE